MKPPVFRAAAAADVEEAYRWYERQRTGLGDEFLASVEAALEAILLHPDTAPIVHRDTHRLLVRRFPYGGHYRQIEGQIVLVARFHAKRNPRQVVRVQAVGIKDGNRVWIGGKDVELK